MRRLGGKRGYAWVFLRAEAYTEQLLILGRPRI